MKRLAKVDEDGNESDSFLARMRSAQIQQGDLDFTRQKYGVDLPDDVVELIARQQAVARPLVEQYHIMAEQTPTLALARAAAVEEIDEILDVVVAMDLSELGDIGDFDDEYTCPRCAHRWSGAPNFRTGYGDKVYIPTGRISSKTGRPTSKRYGPPVRNNTSFKYGRNWRGASAMALPRGFGNRPIGAAINSGTWRKKMKPNTQTHG